jgi:hypothetical protein
MSRHLLAFLLSELKTVRVICKNKNCGVVAEVSLNELAVSTGQFGRCAFCNMTFGHPKTEPVVVAFAQAAVALRGVKDFVELEFVLPDDGE